MLYIISACTTCVPKQPTEIPHRQTAHTFGLSANCNIHYESTDSSRKRIHHLLIRIASILKIKGPSSHVINKQKLRNQLLLQIRWSYDIYLFSGSCTNTTPLVREFRSFQMYTRESPLGFKSAVELWSFIVSFLLQYSCSLSVSPIHAFTCILENHQLGFKQAVGCCLLVCILPPPAGCLLFSTSHRPPHFVGGFCPQR